MSMFAEKHNCPFCKCTEPLPPQEAQQNADCGEAGHPDHCGNAQCLPSARRSAPDSDALVKRLRDCKNRIGDMCKEGRPPKMSIPARPDYDDDLIICTAIDDAIAALTAPADAGVVVPSGEAIANAIFEAGDEPDDKVQRIAFRGGKYPVDETNLGGLNKAALVAVINRALLTAASAKEPK